ncbi:hypothetical protein ACFL0O_10865, partial [Thermodesulfobacteriota bacterium]
HHFTLHGQISPFSTDHTGNEWFLQTNQVSCTGASPRLQAQDKSTKVLLLLSGVGQIQATRSASVI